MGWTSHDVVAVIRRQLGTRAVGHSGTLDPFATGLLVVLVGKATRLARFVEGMSKQYRATVTFGFSTDTDDATGTPIEQCVPERWPARDALQDIANGFLGEQLQRPPAFSAKHVNGTRSHVLARRGEAPVLPDVAVRIDAIELLEWSAPHLVLDATVGRGTYVRSIARDFGIRAGIPAHCSALRRTLVGRFDVANAIAPERATAEQLIPAAELVAHLAHEQLDDSGVREIGFGRRVKQQHESAETGALIGPTGQLIAIAAGRDGWWQPEVVLEPAS